jgi:tetratricopeptide (TPR) repeat protein
LDQARKPVGDASVHLDQTGSASSQETTTNAAGAFTFSSTEGTHYLLSAEKAGARSSTTAITASSSSDQEQFDLILESAGHATASSPIAPPPMEFTDKPNFTVAGIVDWTAVGGHGSDATLRTSEALSRETLTLKPEGTGDGAPDKTTRTGQAESELKAALASDPKSFEANHRLGDFYFRAGQYGQAIPLLKASSEIDSANRQNEYELAQAYKEDGEYALAREHAAKLLKQKEDADIDRLLGEIDEKLGDPLNAVHEFERAARLEPSEQNYFEWGSELLLHRAVWQAKDVFQKGAAAYPKSARMLAALGTALFAGARYGEAAARLCEASDLDPANSEPYIFMGKAEMAAPAPLDCIEQRLQRFVTLQPNNPLANYFYAMAILKRHEQSPDPQATQQAETLFANAVNIDSKCGDGYLQLGILSASRRDLQKAVGYYTKAVEADPQLGDAHYRLAVAYDRLGKPDLAKQEFQLHNEIEKQQSAAVEQQRRDVKQFLVVLESQPKPPQAR